MYALKKCPTLYPQIQSDIQVRVKEQISSLLSANSAIDPLSEASSSRRQAR